MFLSYTPVINLLAGAVRYAARVIPGRTVFDRWRRYLAVVDDDDDGGADDDDDADADEMVVCAQAVR